MNGEQCLSLWPRAREMARVHCSGTLARLRNGDGGFYQADDLWQDLFLEFWALASRWQARGALTPSPAGPIGAAPNDGIAGDAGAGRRAPLSDGPAGAPHARCGEVRVPGPHDEAAFWRAWRSVLARGGQTVLRRAPQRLWHGREVALSPHALSLQDEPQEDGASAAAHPGGALSSRVRAGLRTEDEDYGVRLARHERTLAMARALGSLTRIQRAVLYLAAVERLPAEQVARRLGLGSANVVHQRVHQARAALKRRMAGQSGLVQ